MKKRERIKWNLLEDGVTLKMECDGNEAEIDLGKLPVWGSASKLEKYVLLYGVKQTCVDPVNTTLDRFSAVKKRMNLLESLDSEFLPQGRKKMTEAEKRAVKVKKVNKLVAEMVEAGMPQEVAESIALKTWSLESLEVETETEVEVEIPEPAVPLAE